MTLYFYTLTSDTVSCTISWWLASVKEGLMISTSLLFYSYAAVLALTAILSPSELTQRASRSSWRKTKSTTLSKSEDELWPSTDVQMFPAYGNKCLEQAQEESTTVFICFSFFFSSPDGVGLFTCQIID